MHWELCLYIVNEPDCVWILITVEFPASQKWHPIVPDSNTQIYQINLPSSGVWCNAVLNIQDIHIHIRNYSHSFKTEFTINVSLKSKFNFKADLSEQNELDSRLTENSLSLETPTLLYLKNKI